MLETMVKRMRNRDLENIYDGPPACSKFGARLDCVLINVSSVDNCRNGVHAKITSVRVTSGDHYIQVITISSVFRIVADDSNLSSNSRITLLILNIHLFSALLLNATDCSCSSILSLL